MVCYIFIVVLRAIGENLGVSFLEKIKFLEIRNPVGISFNLVFLNPMRHSTTSWHSMGRYIRLMDVLGSVDGVLHIYCGLESNQGNQGFSFLEKV